MIIIPLGKIAVPTPGTAVRVTATPTPCYGIIASPLPTNTGNTYFGVSTLVGSTSVGCIKAFLKPASSGIIDPLIVTGPDGNQMNAADYYVDAAVANEGLLVSYLSM
jgi:hypothetical protein